MKEGIEEWSHQQFSSWVVSHPGQVVLTVVSQRCIHLQGPGATLPGKHRCGDEPSGRARMYVTDPEMHLEIRYTDGWTDGQIGGKANTRTASG